MPCALDAKIHVMPCASDAKGIYAMSYPLDAKIKVTKMFR